MDGIARIAVPTAQLPRLSRAGRTAFSVAQDADEARKATLGEISPAELGSLLAVQERDETDHRNRNARRHCQDMLRLLTELQRSVLADAGVQDAMSRLATLALSVPEAGDPRLSALSRMIALRARVEMARHHKPDVKIGRQVWQNSI